MSSLTDSNGLVTPGGAGGAGAAEAAARQGLRALSESEREAIERHVAQLRARNQHADPLKALPDVDPRRIPRHVAFIMDGNGRWAAGRGLPRMFGHRAGAKAVRELVEESGRLGIEFLTLYSFSLENWKRPKAEVEALMALYMEYMDAQRDEFMRANLRFVQIGRREGLPEECLRRRDEMMALTRDNTAGTLVLAVNYGSRAEITDAVRAIARRVASGELSPEAIDESTIEGALETRGIPDPDLLVRTAGEMRVSNYLLWQISYSELYVTPTLWPDFGPLELHAAVRAYAARERRFGGVKPV
jgi:undecaprenyl diphosphate synthase